MTVLRRLAFGVLTVIAVASVGAVRAAELTVSAAASLAKAFRELGAAFEVGHPGTSVRYNFAASGALLQQIARGAPVDVFAAADQETMDEAQKQGLIATATRTNFVRNTLVVVTPSDARVPATALAELRADRYARVAIGLPASVPVGRYTRAVLEQADLWRVLEPKLVTAQSARQALDYVARGEVDAGFVYATDAATMADRVKVQFTVPTQTPIVYPIAVTRTAGEPSAAHAFVRFVLSPAGQAVMARYGFARP